MDQSIADALRRIYDATDPNHTYDDEYFQKVADKYKGREVEMFRTLYDSIDPNHGYSDEYFQKVVDKYTQTDKKKDVPVVDFTKPITAAKEVLGEGDSVGVKELAQKYGFSKLTEQSIEQTADSIVNAIRNGEVDPTAFGSGWNQVKSGMYAMASDAILNAPTIRPTAVPGVMMPSIDEEAQQRQARQDIKRLQASGYFEDGGLLEKALIQQLTSSKKMEEALKAKGLDPEKTLYDAANSGNAAEFFQRLAMGVAQQAPQLLTQVALSAIPGVGTAAGATFMGSQAGGARLVQALLEDQKLTADDRRAAIGAAVLEGFTEGIMSPVGKLGGKLIDAFKKQGKEAADDIIKQGGAKRILDFSKKLIADAVQEGTEEGLVEVLTPLNEALVQQLSKENPYFDAKAYLKEQYGEGFGERLFESFTLGAATGGAAGAIRGIAEFPKRAATPEEIADIEKRKKDVLDNIPDELRNKIESDDDVSAIVDELIKQEDLSDIEGVVDNYIAQQTEERQAELIDKRGDIISALEALIEQAEVIFPTLGFKTPPVPKPETPVTETPVTETPQEAAPTSPIDDINRRRIEELNALMQETEGMTDEEIDQGATQRIRKRADINAKYDAEIIEEAKKGNITIEEAKNEIAGQWKDEYTSEIEAALQQPVEEAPVEEVAPEGVTPVTETPEEVAPVEEPPLLEPEEIVDQEPEDLDVEDIEKTDDELEAESEQVDLENTPEEDRPKPGQVANLPMSEINADPDRFQYKEVSDKEAGVGGKFKQEGLKFDPTKAGVISVWVDPADGKTYVINGHHRYEFAKRSGATSMNVIYIDAKDASEARIVGAMQNIAEGQGSDLDAAKIFREKGITDPAQLKELGLTLSDSKSKNGLALARLSDGLFNLVAKGELKQSIGVIIGETIDDPNVQEQFYKSIKGKNLNLATIKVLAEDMQYARRRTVQQTDLFGGTTYQEAELERASFIAGIIGILKKTKNLLGKTAKSAEFLAEYGNEIDKFASETGSKQSAMGLAVFNKLRNSSPIIKAIIDEGLDRIAKGENKKTVINETTKRIVEETPNALLQAGFKPTEEGGTVSETGEVRPQGTQEPTVSPEPTAEPVTETPTAEPPAAPTEVTPEQAPEQAVRQEGDSVIVSADASIEITDGKVSFAKGFLDTLKSALSGINIAERSDLMEIPKLLKVFANYVKGKSVVIHKNLEALEAYIEKNNLQLGDYSPQINGFVYGNEIHFIADRGRGDTAKHEFLHLFIGELISSNPKAAQSLHEKMMQIKEYAEIYNSIKNSDGYKEAYGENEGLYIDEAITTYLGLVASGSMPKSNIRQVIEYLNQLLNEFGINYQIDPDLIDVNSFVAGVTAAIKGGYVIPKVSPDYRSPVNNPDTFSAIKGLVDNFAATSASAKAYIESMKAKVLEEYADEEVEGREHLFIMDYFISQLETNAAPDLDFLRYLFNESRKYKGETSSMVGSLMDLMTDYADSYLTPRYQIDVVDPFGAKAENKQQALENFNRWRGGNEYVQGSEVQNIKTGTPVVIRAYHGTTRKFTEFQQQEGFTDQFLGNEVSYFTTSYDDANVNYTSYGPDLKNKIERWYERANDEYRYLSKEDFISEYGITQEQYDSIKEQGIDDTLKSPYKIEDDIILDLFIKADNPVVISNSDYIETYEPITEESKEEAIESIMSSYDVTREEALEDYQDEIDDEARALAGDSNKVYDAVNDAVTQAEPELDYFGKPVEYDNLLNELLDYFDGISTKELFDVLRKNIYSGAVVARVFKNLGYDAIIVPDPNSYFRNMHGMVETDSHIHIFNDQLGNIKLADGSNVEFDQENNDIRYQLDTLITAKYDKIDAPAVISDTAIKSQVSMAHRDVTQSNLYGSLPELEGMVLEYGSGDSQVAATLAEKGVNIFAYEPNQVLPKSKTPVDYSNGWDIREKFDNIIALNIGNVDKYAEQTIIQDVFDKLKIGGKAYLAATNLPNAQRVLNNNAKITKKGKLIEIQRTGLATRPRFQIIGARGLNKEASIAYKAGDTQSLALVNTDMRNLKLAQSLRSMGMHNEVVLSMTGWQMSKLGHWSKVATDLQYNDEAFMLPFLENINRYVKTGKTTRKPVFSSKVKDFATGKDAERLFNQYPELKNFTFKLKYLPKGTLAFYNYNKKTIELTVNELFLQNMYFGPDGFQYIGYLFSSGLNAKQVHEFLLSPDADPEVRKRYKSFYHQYAATIYHEIQHLIQEIEGWMVGASGDIISSAKNNIQHQAIIEYANNQDEYDKLLAKFFKHSKRKRNLILENKPINKELNEIIDDLTNRLKKITPIIKAYPFKPTEIKNLATQYFSLRGVKDSAFEVYQNVGGEIQARAAQKLYGMSPAEKASFIIDEFIIGENLRKKYNEPLDIPITDESYRGINYRYTKGQVRPGAIATIKDGFVNEFETELLIDLADKFHALRLPFYMQSFEIMKLTARYINDQSRINKGALISSLLRYDPDSDTGLDRVGRKVNKAVPDSVKVSDLKKKIKAAKTGPLTIESAKRIYELIAGFSLTSVNILQGKGAPTAPIARYQIDQKVKDMPAKVKMNMFEGVGLPDVLKYQGLKYVPENNRKSIDIISDSVEELSYTQLSQISSILKDKHPDVNRDKYDRLTDLMDKAIVALQTNSDNRAVEFLLQLRKMDTTKIDDHHYKTTLQSLTFGTPTRVALNRYIAATMAYLAAPIRNPVQPRFQIDGEIVPMQMTGGTIKLSQAEKSRAAYIKRKDKDKNVSDTDIVRALMNAYGLTQEIAIAELQYALKRKFIPEPNLTNANLIKAYNKAQSFLNRSRIVNGIVRRWSEFEFTMVDDNKIIKRYEEKVYEREAYFYALAEVITQFNILPEGDMTSVEIATKKYKKEIAKRKKQFLKGKPIDSRLQVWAMNATKNTKASFYEEQLMIKLYGGDRSNPRFKARRKKSLIGIAEANGISYQELNDFLFYRHIPERIDRKNDYIRQEREKVEREIEEAEAEVEEMNEAILQSQGFIADEDPSDPNVKKMQKELDKQIRARDKKLNEIDKKLDDLMTKESLQYATHLGINVDDNGAPITKEYAEARVEALMEKHPTMEQDANAVRDFLMEEHLSILEDNELLPQDRIDHLRNGTSDRSDVVWEHYVPMLVKDDMFEEVSLGSKTYMADSKGPTGLYELGVGGKDFGRDDRYDPIGMMMLTAAANNKFALNNKVKREFANMVDEFNPNDFGVKKGLRGQKLVGREDDGEFEVPTQIGTLQVDDKEKGTRVEFIGKDGQVYTIVGLNPAARNSLIFKSMLADGDSMDGKIVVEFLRRLNNFWRAGITSLNVFFGIGQLLPDALDGGINTIYELQNITQVSKPKLAASYAKNYARTVAFFTGDAVKALVGMENDNELAQAYREFYQYGGKMAWRKLGGERLKAYNDLTRQIEIAQKNGQALPVTTAKKVLASLEAINDSMENFARFAAYLTAKQYGLSLTESAALARESTVDFGAKGRSTAYKYAKLLFLFFGPAVKGLERSVRTLTMGGPAGAITYMGGFAAASAAARMLVYSFADDEEELDRIVNDKYVNQNRFRVPTVVDGNKYPFSVKMPYSPIRIAHSIGIGMVDVYNEKRTVGDIGVDVMSGLQTLLDPVSGTSSLTNYIPNVFRSVFQTNFNSDYAGRPIISPYILLNSNFKKDQYDKGTGLAYIRMAEWAYDNLNLDISPAMTEYFIDQSLNLPAIRKPMQSLEEWIYYISGERPTPDIFKPLYAEGVEDKPLDRNKLVGPLSAFYYESKSEVSDLINFFEFSDKRSRMRDITEKQFDYLLRSSEMMWQNEMVKWSTIKKNLDRLKEKYPEDVNGNQLNWDSHIKRLQDKNTKRNAIRKSLR